MATRSALSKDPETRKTQQHAREAQREMKRKSQRLGLSDEYPDWEAAKEAIHCLSLNDFTPVKDREDFEAVRRALVEESTFTKAVSAIADHFQVARCEVALVTKLKASGSAQPAYRFQFPYNEDAKDVIKDAGDARFDKQRKSWTLTPSEDAGMEILQELDESIAILIDAESLAIHIGPVAPVADDISRAAFRHLPFHMQLSWVDILEHIRLARPRETVERDKMFYHDGRLFKPLPETPLIWTRLPFLLLRYAVSSGQPRYVSYSTVGGIVEQVMFGNSSRGTLGALARFTDTVRDLERYSPDPLGKPVITAPTNDIIKEAEGQCSAWLGPFKGFSDILEAMAGMFPSAVPMLLCSDYTSLTSTGYGADSYRRGIDAYVDLRESSHAYYGAIRSFFPEPLPGATLVTPATYFPIVVTRGVVESMASREDGEDDFIALIARELAHWLIYEGDLPPGGEEDTAPPSSAWHNRRLLRSLLADALVYIYTGHRPKASLENGPKAFRVVCTKLLREITVPRLDSLKRGIPESEPWAFNDVIDAAMMAFDALPDALQEHVQQARAERQEKRVVG